MSRKKAKKLNYPKLILCILVLVLIIWGLIKIFNNSYTQQVSSLPEEKTTSEVTLNGDETIYLYKNEEYIEPGFSAKDSKENDLTNEVKVENNIDITKTGEYEVKYSLSDNAVKTRKVVVKEATLLLNGKKSNNSLAVLMYHYFYDASKGETGKNSNWMEISKFEDQLNYLKENNYYYPTWQEVADFVDGKIDLPKNSIVITMDDGHKSVYNLAIPLLNEYNIPATAFIITKKFDTANVEKYKDSTINFESHTNNMHRGGGSIGHGGIFTALSIEESVADLKESIEKLGGNSGALAYPYGDCTERTKQAAQQAGFKVAFTTVNKKLKPGMDKYELPRVRMFSDITLNGFINSI